MLCHCACCHIKKEVIYEEYNQPGSGAQSASYPRDTRGSFPEGKEDWRETDHSPPSSVEVKK
jgi:hypothetical protein